MGMGSGIMNSIASMGLNNQNSVNQFILTNAAEESGTQLTNIQLTNQEQEQFGSMLGAGVGAIANIYGSSQLNK